ncbi:MAG TPA: hypothetical protein VFA65_05230 [Bryobacteraceae bacterium]|nr:hypothetical protein [Bryobacteraceae bacterium]
MEHVEVEQLDSKQVQLTGILSARTTRKLFQPAQSSVPYKAPAVMHAELVNMALAGEEILHANSLATLTNNFIVVRRPEVHAEAIIGLPCISGIRHIKTTRPGLLVIASGIFLVAAAAACSKQGGQAQIPLAVVGTLFVLGYFMTRRAAVAFVVNREATETMHGSLSEAAELLEAMEKATNATPAEAIIDSQAVQEALPV